MILYLRSVPLPSLERRTSIEFTASVQERCLPSSIPEHFRLQREAERRRMQAAPAKVFRDAVFPAASLNTFVGQLHVGCSAQIVQGRCLPNTVPEHFCRPNGKSVQGWLRMFSTLNSVWDARNNLVPLPIINNCSLGQSALGTLHK